MPGVFYVNGQGVPKDYGKAAHWFRLAANQGNARAQYSLGLLYYKGQGVPKDHGKGAHWFRLAANQGNARAQFNLGLLYWIGHGVPVDYEVAYKWFVLAKASNDSYVSKIASKKLKLLIPLMTHDQIAEGQRLARKWTLAKRRKSNP